MPRPTTPRDRGTARPRARSGGWWLAVSVVALLIAAVLVSAYALGHSRAEVATPPALPSTSRPTAAGGPTASPTPSVTPQRSLPAATDTTSTPASPAAALSPAAPTSAASGPRPSLTQTNVVIVTAGWRDGAASVSGYATVVENGGTCTVTLSRDGVILTGSRPATVDATTTSCGVITVRDARLTAGTWRAVLSYTSPTSTGTSAPTSIVIG